MLRTLVTSAIAAAVLATAAVPAQAKALDPNVVTDLRTIKTNADQIAAGRYTGKAVQGPAREIALAWARIAPALSRNGEVLVETKMANASISTLERDWQTSKNVRGEAKDVSASVADLQSAAAS